MNPHTRTAGYSYREAQEEREREREKAWEGEPGGWTVDGVRVVRSSNDVVDQAAEQDTESEEFGHCRQNQPADAALTETPGGRGGVLKVVMSDQPGGGRQRLGGDVHTLTHAGK